VFLIGLVVANALAGSQFGKYTNKAQASLLVLCGLNESLGVTPMSW
jgi:hypothetical protein